MTEVLAKIKWTKILLLWQQISFVHLIKTVFDIYVYVILGLLLTLFLVCVCVCVFDTGVFRGNKAQVEEYLELLQPVIFQSYEGESLPTCSPHISSSSAPL